MEWRPVLDNLNFSAPWETTQTLSLQKLKVWSFHSFFQALEKFGIHTHTCICQASRKKMSKPIKWTVRIYSNTLSNQKTEPKQKKGEKKPKSQKQQRQRKLQYAIREKKKGKGTQSHRKIGGGGGGGGRNIINKGCVTLWPCHLNLKVS